jgi:hypothetical protein
MNLELFTQHEILVLGSVWVTISLLSCQKTTKPAALLLRSGTFEQGSFNLSILLNAECKPQT